MKLLILLIFIAVPLAEIAVFIKVGEVIGIAATVALVILTAVIGVALLKRQGLAALTRAQQTIDAGELPVDSVIDGVCLLVAGAFLLTPGLITDTAGFLLLVPAFRHALAHWAFARVKESGNFRVWTSGGGRPPGGPPPGPGSAPGGAPVIEGEFEEVDRPTQSGPRTTPGRGGDGNSPWKK